MERKKRFVAMLLSLLMVFSICTNATYAEEDTVKADSIVNETVDEEVEEATNDDTNVLASEEVDVIDDETTEATVVTSTSDDESADTDETTATVSASATATNSLTATNDSDEGIAVAAEEDEDTTITAVYLDGIYGNDSNDGTSIVAAVATYKKAIELANSNNVTTIYVTGTISISSDSYTWNDNVSLIRDSSFTNGPLIELNGGSLTLSDITIDGDNISTEVPLIKVTSSNSTLTINSETTIQNNVNTKAELDANAGTVNVSAGNLIMNSGTIKSNSGGWGGGITMFGKTNTSTFIMNGGTISNNSATDGGGVLLYGNSTFYMYKGNIDYNSAEQMGGGLGVWSGSTAYIYAGSISNNKTTKIYTTTGTNSFGGGGIYINGSGTDFGAGTCYLYNVELTGNANTTTSQPSLRSVISACATGNVKIYVTDGSVIHDNDKTAVYDIVLYSSSGSDFNVTPFMLGGATYDWHTVGRINATNNPTSWAASTVGLDSLIHSTSSARYGTIASTSSGTVTGLDRVSVYVNNNSSGGWGAAIGCNGNLIIGKDDGNVTLNIEKNWNLENENDIPDSVDVSVIATDSKGYVANLGSVTLTKENDWETSIDGLPKYDSYGGLYTYSLKEISNDYFSIITMNEVDDNDDDNNTDKYEVKINNLLKTNLTLEKTVKGDTSADKFTFQIDLVYQDVPYTGTVEGVDANEKDVPVEFENGTATVTLAADESITLTLGAGMTYSIEEIDSQDALDVTYSIDDGESIAETSLKGTLTKDNTTISFENNYETVDISGTKTWDDADNQDGKRPESITVRLFVDGDEIDNQTITAEDNWTYIFENLPKYSNGEKINYAVTEDAVKDYSTTYDGYDITNSYTPEKTSVTVVKAWEDSNDQDGIRPDEITVVLVKNGEATNQTVTLNADNNWEASFTDLDVYSNGIAIEYTVEEVSVEGYTSVVTGSMSEGFVITNTHTPTPTDPTAPDDTTPTTPSEPEGSTPSETTTPTTSTETTPTETTTSNTTTTETVETNVKTGDETQIIGYCLLGGFALIGAYYTRKKKYN